MTESQQSAEETVHELARLFMERHQTITLADSKETYFFNTDRGYYMPARIEIGPFCERIIGSGASIHVVREVTDKITRYNPRNIEDLERLASDMMLINVQNGLVDPRTKTLFPHNPNFWSVNRLPLTYDPAARCPKIMAFLRKSLATNAISLVKKMLGDLLLSDYRSKCFYILHGTGNNGKGALGQLLAKFVGRENFTSCSLQQISDDKFVMAELFGKMVNFHGDISADTVKNWDIIRTLTGNDRVTCRRIHSSPFQFTNRAKLIFACNDLPIIEKSHSTMSRIVLIEFPYTFEGKEMDRTLIEKLTTPAEMSGLLNLAIDGLKQLLREGPGDPNCTVAETMNRYKELSDHVGHFIKESFDETPSGMVEPHVLYSMYEKYCQEKKVSVVLDKLRLGSKLAALGIAEVRRRVNGKPRWVYLGINMKQTVTAPLFSPGPKNDAAPG